MTGWSIKSLIDILNCRELSMVWFHTGFEFGKLFWLSRNYCKTLLRYFSANWNRCLCNTRQRTVRAWTLLQSNDAERWRVWTQIISSFVLHKSDIKPLFTIMAWDSMDGMSHTRDLTGICCCRKQTILLSVSGQYQTGIHNVINDVPVYCTLMMHTAQKLTGISIWSVSDVARTFF